MKLFRCFLSVYRKEKKISQNELAKKLGISRKTLSKIENGSNTDLYTAMTISKLIEKPITEIFKIK